MKKLLAILTLTLLTAWLYADWEQAYKALADAVAAGDYFGYSVSISSDYAIVGVRGDDDNGEGSGSTYVFHRNETVWAQQAKLTADDGAAWDHFGCSVSISGDYAIVGAHWDDDDGEKSGSAYIFHRSGTVWTQQAKLTADDGAEDDKFGSSVSISGDYVVVGAYWDDDNGDESGSAYIFHRSGTVWTQQAKLTADDGAEGDYFGLSVSISGDDAIVGAQYDDANGLSSGSAYIFHRSGAVWTQQEKLTADDVTEYACFGLSVSISGDDAIVGATYDDANGPSSGSAYIFHRNGYEWIQQVKLTADDGAAHDYFGKSVSISGDYAIVGAHCDEDNGENSGSAYIFHRNGTVWSQQAKLTPDDGAEGDRFGRSLSISGDHVIVGAYGDDDNGYWTGSAYMFENPDVAIDKDFPEMPVATLQAAYPNPFNPETTIAFSLSLPGQATVTVYNVRGEKLATLVDEYMQAGEHAFTWTAEGCASGIYFYRLETGGHTEVRKALLLK
ncbi:MAG: T9SS type A sorting domain-containing protein [Candidatus Cloacimonetes bacterium]|nr:T9SS type A sorting domain-containing protein [Candidatus Cloacimonadota bacterium]